MNYSTDELQLIILQSHSIQSDLISFDPGIEDNSKKEGDRKERARDQEKKAC